MRMFVTATICILSYVGMFAFLLLSVDGGIEVESYWMCMVMMMLCCAVFGYTCREIEKIIKK